MLPHGSWYSTFGLASVLVLRCLGRGLTFQRVSAKGDGLRRNRVRFRDQPSENRCFSLERQRSNDPCRGYSGFSATSAPGRTRTQGAEISDKTAFFGFASVAPCVPMPPLSAGAGYDLCTCFGVRFGAADSGFPRRFRWFRSRGSCGAWWNHISRQGRQAPSKSRHRRGETIAIPPCVPMGSRCVRSPVTMKCARAATAAAIT